MARNLIIGAIEGYRFEQIAPFFLTLRKVGYSGDVVIFQRGLDAPSRRRLIDVGVELIELPAAGLRNPITGRRHMGQGGFGDVLSAWLRVLHTAPAPRAVKERWKLDFAKRFFHIANLRFLVAEHYLREHLELYRYVMISDVRDVVFQADPFGFEGVDRLSTFLESAPLSMETSRHYREWIEAAFGVAETGLLRSARLSCCAITLGPAAGMLGYLAAMARVIGGNYTRQPYLFGLDSAAHNHICLHQSAPGLNLLENMEGPVAHLGSALPEMIRFDASGRLINQAGDIIPTVHQYDRIPELAAAFSGVGRGA